MSDPLALFTRLIDETFNAGDLEVLEELVAPDFVEHQFKSHQRPAVQIRRATDGVAAVVGDISIPRPWMGVALAALPADQISGHR
jgi:hypothetical protein